MVDYYAAFFNCTPVGPGVRLYCAIGLCRYYLFKLVPFYDGPDIKLFVLVGLVCCLAYRGSSGVFLLLRISVIYSAPLDPHRHVAN